MASWLAIPCLATATAAASSLSATAHVACGRCWRGPGQQSSQQPSKEQQHALRYTAPLTPAPAEEQKTTDPPPPFIIALTELLRMLKEE